MPILTATDYQNIRSLLDSRLTPKNLPDSDLLPFVDDAERWARERDPSWETRAGDELARLKRAVQHYAAALRLPSIRLPEEEVQKRDVEGRHEVDVRVRYAKVDVEARVAELVGLAESAITQNQSATYQPDPPNMFAVARVRRSTYCGPCE